MIFDLCGGTGAWSRPYAANGYNVVIVDPSGEHVRLTVAEFLESKYVLQAVTGIICAPPCTEFAGAGARWWKDKDPQLLIDAIQVVRDCLKAVEIFKPHWWVLENPVGRIAKCVPELGKFKMTYQPWEYGDPWTKRTCLWGDFNIPVKTPVEPAEGGKIWRMGPSPDRARLRSITPPGFATAFYEANQ